MTHLLSHISATRIAQALRAPLGTPVILDTDIGTDIDDALALAMLLGCPEYDVIGCTATYIPANLVGCHTTKGHHLRDQLTERSPDDWPLPRRRVDMLRALLDLAGRSDVPAVNGAPGTFNGRRTVFWHGHEGAILPAPTVDPESSALAHDWILDQAAARPGEVDVLAIGPMTNLARAFATDPPRFRMLRRIIFMGGHAAGTTEHNFLSDPEAAAVVLGSGVPLFMVGAELTRQTMVPGWMTERLERCPSAVGQAVAAMLRAYVHGFHRDWTYNHDSLAVYAAFHSDTLAWDDVRVSLDREAKMTDAMDGIPLRRLRMDGYSAFDAFFIDRVERLCAHQRGRRPHVFVSGSRLSGKELACERVGVALADADCAVVHGGSDVGEAVARARLSGGASPGLPLVVQLGLTMPSRAGGAAGVGRIALPGGWTGLRERALAMADVVVDFGGGDGNREEVAIARRRRIPVFRADDTGDLTRVEGDGVT